MARTKSTKLTEKYVMKVLDKETNEWVFVSGPTKTVEVVQGTLPRPSVGGMSLPSMHQQDNCLWLAITQLESENEWLKDKLKIAEKQIQRVAEFADRFESIKHHAVTEFADNNDHHFGDTFANTFMDYSGTGWGKYIRDVTMEDVEEDAEEDVEEDEDMVDAE